MGTKSGVHSIIQRLPGRCQLFVFQIQLVASPNIPAGPAANWRWPFVIVALPSLFVTGMMLALVQEPPRGITEPALQVKIYAEAPGVVLPLPKLQETGFVQALSMGCTV